MTTNTPKRIGVLGFEGANLLDIAGPIEAFDSARLSQGPSAPVHCYDITLLAFTTRAFKTESGILMKPTGTIAGAGVFDTLIIPGGRGIRDPRVNASVSAWILEEAPRTRRIASICTGLYGLAATGLLDGRRATTHWGFAKDAAARFPAVRVDPNPLFVKDGKYYSSAGVTAGIDLTLALIEEDLGRKMALGVARELVVYLKRPGGQEQFSEPLQFQTQASDRFTEIATWISANLRADLTVDSLASRAALCPRQFRRRFKSAFGKNPARYVESLRLGEARRRLTSTRETIEAVASSVGFANADSLRRLFRLRFGVAPAEYRGRFRSSARPEGPTVEAA